ncbi:LysR substrate-binding domain-containing protein [Herbaspirillum sp. NPDC101397]|uniref:LysR substrate-binding domain-containing protein n=1 Tax=Herbaspirillum sp. NPDC101397 TaxID=3364006 RepID=UPI00383B2C13
MSDKLRSMEVFVAAATAESFAAAAQLLDISAVMVGKHVRTLEQQLGASLLERTTRKQALTEIGARYLELCRDVLASVDNADRVAETLRAMPQGVLRVSAPVSYGLQRLMPVIGEYAAIHPQVHIDLALNNRVVDLAEEAVDVAVRSGPLSDDGLIARPLRPARMLIAASPAYLARRGTPGHPDDLARRDCLIFGALEPGHTWRFSRDAETVHVPVQGSFASNNGQALLAAALAGMGVLVQTDTLLEEHIAAGRLTALLPDWRLPTRALHIVRRPENRPSAKVRSFVDFVLERLG